MKDKPFYYQDNRALHEKRLKERVRAAISKRNIEFTLAHQHDSIPELVRYVRQCKEELGHVPARTEIIGGEFLELRFGSWFNVLRCSGYVNYSGTVPNTPSLEHTELYRAEYDRQWEQHKQAKKDRKKAAEAERRDRKSEKKRAARLAETSENGGLAE